MTGQDFEKRSKERSTEESSNRPIPILQGQVVKLQAEGSKGIGGMRLSKGAPFARLVVKEEAINTDCAVHTGGTLLLIILKHFRERE